VLLKTVTDYLKTTHGSKAEIANEINGVSDMISGDTFTIPLFVIFLLFLSQVSDAVAVVRNSFRSEPQTTPVEDRSVDDEVLNEVEHFVQGHDLLVTLPGATLSLSPRHLDHNEVTATLKFNHKQGRAATLEEGNFSTGRLQGRLPIMFSVSGRDAICARKYTYLI
jgi:hypothetical protein